MKRIFTKIAGSALFMSLIIAGFNGKAQTTLASADTKSKEAKQETATEAPEVKATPKPAEDTSWKPVRRLWGYAFGDYYYKGHSDPLNRGGSNQYTNVPADRNAFQFRRIYLGYDYDITKKFSAEVLLAAEDNAANFGNAPASGSGDQLVDGKYSFYIKLLDLRIKNIWKGTDLVIGQQATPAFPLLSEKIWSYRSIERTVADIRRTPSYDLGAGLQGVFDPATKNFGYNVLIANGTSAKPENDQFKWFYGDIWGKFFDQKLTIDIYADYEKLGFNTATGPEYSRSMIKGYIAYTTSKLTVGVEAFTNFLKNGATATDAGGNKTVVDQRANAISLYARGPIVKDKVGFFVRYDNYNPDTKYDNVAYVTYAGRVGNYDPNTKENFFTAGLDFTPYKNVHFMPNIWYDGYKNQQANVTGAAKYGYDLAYRLTAYFTFGK
ncbi:hypothetical protein [Mucilaginibacter ginsenosidivorans]|uniref:Porin n=1 Tax=Mucilaginibacter ginsenosidivorans TaxID=398053 RepID=A0A5B8V365_9SPHI|nr:hypothetical protein [Mucilaginibacter ginsenosidivorans]QEC65131.1 hypothetical protein FRZ54_22015 [Mucilaginibacter ginsenosidivorans]